MGQALLAFVHMAETYWVRRIFISSVRRYGGRSAQSTRLMLERGFLYIQRNICMHMRLDLSQDVLQLEILITNIDTSCLRHPLLYYQLIS